MGRADPGWRVTMIAAPENAEAIAVETAAPLLHEVLDSPAIPTAQGAEIPPEVARSLAKSTAALGAGVLLERGFGFLANILAARLGGTGTFGAYSLAITSAANISTYAGGGIGATAARFSGKYPHSSEGYGTLARALAIVSVLSAMIAAFALWLGAAPLAALLHKPHLVHLLQWAALSAAAMVILECARGFFVGQRRTRALLLLCSSVGLGTLALLPVVAARHSPVRMIIVQGAVACGAVLLCVALAKSLALRSSASRTETAPLFPMLREVWSFGMVQLAGLVGMNLAGWWLTTLVARDDTTLAQMSFFAVASQLRNIVGLAPSMLTESSYSTMAVTDPELVKTPDSVMALCTFLSTAFAVVLAGITVLVLPWLLHLLYGHAYAKAAAAVSAGLAVAVVHMGNAPAAARLTIVSLKATGMINTVWAVFVGAAGTMLLLHRGSAAAGISILLAGHMLSAGLVLLVLRRHGIAPRGMALVVALGAAASALLALFGAARAHWPVAEPALLAGIVLALGCVWTALYALGRRHRWLPGRAALLQIAASLAMRVRPGRSHA